MIQLLCFPFRLSSMEYVMKSFQGLDLYDVHNVNTVSQGFVDFLSGLSIATLLGSSSTLSSTSSSS